jgi:hypothetical protein
MVPVANPVILLLLQAYGQHRDAVNNSRLFELAYFVVLAAALAMWLGGYLRKWLGWPDIGQDRGPLRLGLSDPQPKRHQRDRKHGDEQP